MHPLYKISIHSIRCLRIAQNVALVAEVLVAEVLVVATDALHVARDVAADAQNAVLDATSTLA